MIQFEHKKRIVEACFPRDDEQAEKYWHDIVPVKFGYVTQWLEIEGDNEWATYQIPQDAAFLLIARVECYTTTFVAAAPGFGVFSPPPNALAYWALSDQSATNPNRQTPTVPIHILADVDEYLIAPQDHRITLFAGLPAPPDGNARFIRTTVYAYLCGGLIAGKIGDSESTYWSGVR